MTDKSHSMTRLDLEKLTDKLIRIPQDEWALRGNAQKGIIGGAGTISAKLENGVKVEIERPDSCYQNAWYRRGYMIRIIGDDFEAISPVGHGAVVYERIVREQRRILENQKNREEKIQNKKFQEFLGSD